MGIKKSNNNSCVTKIERYVIDSKIPEDEDLKSVVQFYLSKHGQKYFSKIFCLFLQFICLDQGEKDLERVLGHINSDLDGRFSLVRSAESNLGNFICDIVLQVKYIIKKYF